jgi:hypothetical protein
VVAWAIFLERFGRGGLIRPLAFIASACLLLPTGAIVGEIFGFDPELLLHELYAVGLVVMVVMTALLWRERKALAAGA